MSYPQPQQPVRRDSHLSEVVVAGLIAHEVVQAKVRADQQRVEDDVLRRGHAAWQVLQATGQATAEQLQMIAEAEHVLAVRAQREAQAEASARAWNGFWSLVLTPLGLWLAVVASPWWLLLSVLGVLLGLGCLSDPEHPT